MQLQVETRDRGFRRMGELATVRILPAEIDDQIAVPEMEGAVIIDAIELDMLMQRRNIVGVEDAVGDDGPIGIRIADLIGELAGQ